MSSPRWNTPPDDDAPTVSSQAYQSAGRSTSWGLREAAVKSAIDGDDPMLRSVAIFDSPAGKLSPLGKSFPLELKRPKSLFSKKSDPYRKDQLRHQNVISARPKPSLSVSKTSWKIPSNTLECVPDRFILARTHRFIGDTLASQVSARISACLCSRSIQVTYDDETPKAKCKNMDFVTFCIRLYSGRGEYNHGIIVEIQRRSGDSLSFQKDCRAILDAAEGEEEEYTEFSCLTTPVSKMDFLKNVEVPQFSAEKEAKEAFDIASRLIGQDSPDRNLLGLQSLRVLTDPSKSSAEVSLSVAKSIFGQENSIILNYIASLARCGMDSSDSDNVLKEEICNAALSTLSNALEAAATHDCLCGIMKGLPSFVDTFVPLLIGNLKIAKGNPHSAVYAVKALNTIVNASNDARMKAQEIGAIILLEEVINFGLGNHSSLARESQRCVSDLTCH